MFRILLTAYFSLVAACGPALCCCSFQSLASAIGSEGCCVKQAALDEHDHHGGHGHHGHQHASDGHHYHSAAKPLAENQAVPHDAGDVPQICDEHPCGCDRDEKQLVSLPKKHVDEQRGDWDAHLSFVPVTSATYPLGSTSATSGLLGGTSPASLYGREMLRAYQILLI